MIVMPQEALLAAEELAWDKKMSALRQPASKGPSPGNLQVEQTEEDPEVRVMCCVTLLALPVQRGAAARWHLCLPPFLLQDDEESASDDFMEPNRTDGSQGLDWEEGGEGDDYQ